MKKLDISTNKYPNVFVLIDDEDFDWLGQWKWRLNNGGYVIRTQVFKRINGKQPSKNIYMHRLLNETPLGFETDHINRNKLDNRKSNLRTVNRSQNELNKNLRNDNSSGYKGVCWDKKVNKWVARVWKNRKEIFLGRFITIEEAILCRQEAEKIYYSL